MTYEFNIGAFFLGLFIMILGAVFMRFHRVFADNLAGGVMSYDKFRLWALITCGAGFLVSLNLHYYILQLLFGAVFNR